MKTKKEVQERIEAIHRAIKECEKTIEQCQVYSTADPEGLRGTRILKNMHLTELRVLRWVYHDD